MNRLKMAQSQAVIGLRQEGWTHRRIARKLGVDRETVSHYGKIQNATTSNPAISPPRVESLFQRERPKKFLLENVVCVEKTEEGALPTISTFYGMIIVQPIFMFSI